MEIFLTADVGSILLNRFVVIIGDSIQRGIYKDLVLLLQRNRYLTQSELKKKGEHIFMDDELIEGGCKGEMSNGISYREVRQYRTDVHLVRFYFVTRCYNTYMESILRDLKEEPYPDIVIMNSCLWDISRYGRDAIDDYKMNLVTLFTRFSQCLPSDCLVIWNTTLPISSSARGGFLVPEVEFMTTTLRLDILEANYYARIVAAEHGFDVLDLHFYLRHHLHRRVHDGVHWDMLAHRHITNLILSHICEAWCIPMPGRRPVTFGSYGSFGARNGYYQHHAQYEQMTAEAFQPQAYQQVFLSQLKTGLENMRSLNQQFAFGSQPPLNRKNLMASYGSSNTGSHGYRPLLWAPYQQNDCQRAVQTELHSRYRPYRRKK